MNYIIRDICIEQDLLNFHRIHSDADSMLYYGMEPADSIEKSLELLYTYISAIEQGKMIIKVIADATTSEYVGELGLFNIHNLHHRANSYCILLPEYRKKGILKYISEGFYSMIFSTTSINRIQAHVDSRNVNAKNSLTGIGYQYEGRLYQYEFDKEEYIDIDVYSLLRKNYFSNE